jgi:DmsE family decaheme c-type cytochrome
VRARASVWEKRGSLAAGVLALGLLALGASGNAAETPAQTAEPQAQAAAPEATEPAKQEAEPEYTKRGADTCLRCHDESSEFPVLSIFKTKHAQPADPRTPFAQLQCETCHGPGAEHAEEVPEGQQQAPIIKFGADSWVPIEKQNGICLGCHEGHSRIAWKTSPHGGNDVACASCHRVHAMHDPVLATAEQPDVCYTCHQHVRAEFDKPSVHPVRFAQMACNSCHEVHGAMAAKLLIKPTLNETCYTCHAEKRGPFLWEHAPVAEDCTNCHTPHGSLHPTLLVRRAPLLCQQCHSQLGHPSVARTGTGLADGNPSGFLLTGACMNCHSQVHGSNDPSGVTLMR